MASYTSTGPAGVDSEMAFAAVMASHLIAEQAHPVIPSGALPCKISLQRRDGPEGFDDIVVEWQRNDIVGLVFIQSKRPIAISNNETFRKLARALAVCEREGEWSAAIVATSISPNLEDVQALLESARLSSDHKEFEQRWAQPDVLNDAKRKVLKGFSAATEGLADAAAWSAMCRLTVIEHDLALHSSRDRRSGIEILSRAIAVGTDAEANFEAIRSKFLATADLSPTFDRTSLAHSIPSLAIQPLERYRTAIDKIHTESRGAVTAIKDQINGPGCSITLLRPECWAELKQSFATHKNVRLQGEAGCGKSSLLKRYVEFFDGNLLVLNERRLSGSSWAEITATLGGSINAAETIDAMASSGSCLLAIDGADRMLLDHRRGVVLDLFRAISASSLKSRWSIITSGRDFGTQDVILEALSEAELEVGQAIAIGSLEDQDLALVTSVFPNVSSLVGRSDLAGLNKNPFMLQQLLASNELPSILTEVGLADAWATRGASATPPHHSRDLAVSQLASSRLASPTVVPSISDIDTEGVATLIAKGSARQQDLSSGITFAHDVLEDWALARELERNWLTLPEQLKSAGEPLWWQSAVRLVGQIKLERGRLDEWNTLYSELKSDEDLDPAWARLVLAAPLHSERAGELLEGLGAILMDQEGKMLGALLETMRVFETRVNQNILTSPLFAELSQAERLSTASHFKVPILRSWIAFFRWSLPQWSSWPKKHIPVLVELAEIWANHYERMPNWVSKRIAIHVERWLVAVEDYEHPEDRRNYDSERPPLLL